MPFRYKIDILEALKNKGYTTYKIRKENILSESTIQKIRHNEMLSLASIDQLCELLDLTPSDIIEYYK